MASERLLSLKFLATSSRIKPISRSCLCLDAQAEIEETKGLYAHDAGIDAGGFVNGLRGSVRPVITYAFFILFCTIKGVTLYAMVTTHGMDLSAGMLSIWDDETQAIFSAIIAFWFGNRAMSKARAHIASRKG